MSLSQDELAQAQSVIREFGYDVQEHCRVAADVLIRLGLHSEAADTINASRALLDILREVSGKDFLLSGVDAPN